MPPTGGSAWLQTTSLPDSDLEWIVFFAAGPAIQILAIIVGLLIVRVAQKIKLRLFGLLLALVNSFGLGVYYGASFVRQIGGDELLLGKYLNLAPTVVAGVFAALALAGLVLALACLRARKERWRMALYLPLATLPQGPLIFSSNSLIREQVDAGNSIFLLNMGFSAPIYVLALLALAGVLWSLRPETTSAPNPT